LAAQSCRFGDLPDARLVAGHVPHGLKLGATVAGLAASITVAIRLGMLDPRRPSQRTPKKKGAGARPALSWNVHRLARIQRARLAQGRLSAARRSRVQHQRDRGVERTQDAQRDCGLHEVRRSGRDGARGGDQSANIAVKTPWPRLSNSGKSSTKTIAGRVTWWAREDSNLQPDRYERLTAGRVASGRGQGGAGYNGRTERVAKRGWPFPPIGPILLRRLTRVT